MAPRFLTLTLPALMLTLGLAHSTLAATLVDVFETAVDSDPAYRQAEANLAAVEENVTQARGNLWRPIIALRGSGARNRQDVSIDGGFAFGAGGRTTFNSRSLAINLTQPVYYYDRWMQVQQADQQVQQAEMQLAVALQDLMIRVAERYFDILAAEDNLSFASAELEALTQQSEQAQARFEVGLVPILDAQEAQAGADRARASVVVAENALQNAIEALREVTDRTFDSLTPLGEDLVLEEPTPADVDAWAEQAAAQNLDVAVARLGADIAEQEIAVQQAGRLPTLDVVADYGHSRSGGRFGDSTVNSGSIGMQFNLPIYSAGQISSRTRQAGHRHEEAVARLDSARRAALRQARQAFLGVRADISSVKALAQAVLSSQTALDSTQQGFAVGTRTAVDVVTAQRGLAQAQRDFARARYDYVLDVLRLKRAAGTLSPDDIVTADDWLKADSAL